MRLVIDSLVALMLAAVLGGVVVYYRHEEARQTNLLQTQESLRQLSQQVMVQSTLRQTDLTDEGFPVGIEPEWFRQGVPRNHLVGPGHPWIDVAGPQERDLHHPPVRVIRDREAAFWYNPYRGVIRARVPEGMSDASVLHLYNRVNGTRLRDLIAGEQG